MSSSVIAAFVQYLNIALITLMALFAAYGAVVLFYGKAATVRAGRVLPAFCAAALAAFALEATAFNLWSYLRYVSGPPMGGALAQSKTDPNIVEASDGTKVELIDGGVRFGNLDRRVTSVFIDVGFNGAETAEAILQWTDEAITAHYSKKLYKYLPRENYALLQSCGKASEISVMFDLNAAAGAVEIKEIVLNKPIPFYFSGLRLLVVSILLFALLALVHKPLRAKAAYYLFEYRFDPKNEKQNAVYACVAALLIFYSFVCVYTSLSDAEMEDPRAAQYNKFLTDAFIAGRTNLDYGNPEILLNAERPYDYIYRITSGIHGQETAKVTDWAWYKGKYYCYYGAVPAALLYVPYKLVTGNYLSNQAGVFLFYMIAIVVLAALWRYCAAKYMPDTRYALYLLSLPTLFFASCLFMDMRSSAFYPIPKSAGFMFTAAGIFLLLKSVDGEKVSRLKLFFACLCLALVFGCRPNMGLASLLVPVVLWKHKTWKLAALALLPYIIVAIPLCMYNYARFDSVFEFGAKYSLTGVNNVVDMGKQNPLGKIFQAFLYGAYLLFTPPGKHSIFFPFVDAFTNRALAGGNHINSGILCNNQGIFGLFNFPAVFLLFYMLKNIRGKDKPKEHRVLWASLIVGAAIMLSVVVAGHGVSSRFHVDYAVFIIIPALFCAYYMSRDSAGRHTPPPPTTIRLYSA